MVVVKPVVVQLRTVQDVLIVAVDQVVVVDHDITDAPARGGVSILPVPVFVPVLYADVYHSEHQRVMLIIIPINRDLLMLYHI